jgi:peptidoglycan hydrolase-like protein with peptidoglycan-binding domain
MANIESLEDQVRVCLSSSFIKKETITMSVPSDFPTVQIGDSGESVEYLQNLLNSYDQALLDADGEFGESTELAVKAFQEKSGVSSDGIVGNETWALLQALVAADPESSEDC